MNHIQSAAVKLGVSAAAAIIVYVRLRRTENAAERWGLQAPTFWLAGLAIVGTAESVPELQRIARDERNPSQGAAIAALQALDQKSRKQ